MLSKQAFFTMVRAMSEPEPGEREFFEQTAEEVLRSENPRLKQLLQWCKNTAAVLQQCSGDQQLQTKHAAIMASNLLLEINYIEATGDLMTHPRADITPFSRSDRHCVLYEFEVDTQKNVIRICAKAMHVLTATEYEAVQFMHIEFPLETDPALFSHLKSPIVVAS